MIDVRYAPERRYVIVLVGGLGVSMSVLLLALVMVAFTHSVPSDRCRSVQHAAGPADASRGGGGRGPSPCGWRSSRRSPSRGHGCWAVCPQ